MSNSYVQNKWKSNLKEPATQVEELVISILLLGMGCGADILSVGDFSHGFKSSLEYVVGVPLTYGLTFPWGKKITFKKLIGAGT